MASTYHLWEDSDPSPTASPSGPPVTRLNVAGAPADRADMALNTEVEGAHEVERIAHIDLRLIDGTYRSSAGEDVEEMDRLQQKVSLLAMQKDYWQQRSIEQADKLQSAQAELARLGEALTRAVAAPAPTA